MITEETLMAYADGELTDEDRALVETALLDNGQLLTALADEWRLRRSLLALYGPTANEEVPERLRRLLESPAGAPSSTATNVSRVRSGWWQNVAAIAATLVLGIFLGLSLSISNPPAAGETARLADRELSQVLDLQLASTQSSDAPIQIGISFIGPEGAPCRTFQSLNAAGLACHDEGGWALRLVAPFERSGTFEYQKAGSATALIMQSAQELIAGDPMDAVEERNARDRGWRNRKR